MFWNHKMDWHVQVSMTQKILVVLCLTAIAGCSVGPQAGPQGQAPSAGTYNPVSKTLNDR
jgi:hypothetical protein